MDVNGLLQSRVEAEFLCKFLCKGGTPPLPAVPRTIPAGHRSEIPMNADTALDFPVQPLRPGQLADPALPHLSWLWHGFLARGRMTALVGSSKSGKTTLASLLLARCPLTLPSAPRLGEREG